MQAQGQEGRARLWSEGRQAMVSPRLSQLGRSMFLDKEVRFMQTKNYNILSGL
jgi:hypothetical protein